MLLYIIPAASVQKASSRQKAHRMQCELETYQAAAGYVICVLSVSTTHLHNIHIWDQICSKNLKKNRITGFSKSLLKFKASHT